ncbi:hypothetical protein FW774_00965 (plasmid) [Pedobacter sp. BS3]|uniref:hypothetical protein n=1 Tax=Pedobacter sp. BS3 TaxID=2567937 RepID=UPI0011F066DE|nr:hypothetical protein [Pedobacter sp. BS3]TZF85680.1 hypothetical protein FW774_00965 [Pedobacter sp. BS3]
MVVSEIQLYEMLKTKIGEREAEAFIEILEKKVDRKFEELKTVLATKDDITKSKLDMVKWMVGFWVAQMAAIIGLYFSH